MKRGFVLRCVHNQKVKQTIYETIDFEMGVFPLKKCPGLSDNDQFDTNN